MQKLDDVLRRVEANELTEDDCQTIRTLLASYVHLTELVKDKNTSLARLRKLLFGASTEKTAAVIGGSKDSQPPSAGSDSRLPTAPKSKCDRGKRRENATTRARPQRGRRLRRGGEDRGAARVAPAGRSLPEVRAGHGLRDGPAGRAGAAGGPGPRFRPRSTNSRSCVAICAAWSSRPSRPRASARRSTTPRRAA